MQRTRACWRLKRREGSPLEGPDRWCMSSPVFWARLPAAYPLQRKGACEVLKRGGCYCHSGELGWHLQLG